MCAKSAANLLVAAVVLVLQLGGGTPGSKAVEEIERSVTRPVPGAPPPAVSRPDTVWVPDRIIRDPVHGAMLQVPGHWERRLSEREVYVPPLTVCNAVSGDCTTVPAGVRPPAEIRPGP